MSLTVQVGDSTSAPWGRNPVLHGLLTLLGVVATVVVIALLAQGFLHTARATGLLRPVPARAPVTMRDVKRE